MRITGYFIIKDSSNETRRIYEKLLVGFFIIVMGATAKR